MSDSAVVIYILQLQKGAKASVYDDESQSKEEGMMTTLIILGRSRAVNENGRNTFLDSAFSMRVSCPIPTHQAGTAPASRVRCCRHPIRPTNWAVDLHD
jgi:hypothetical protein